MVLLLLTACHDSPAPVAGRPIRPSDMLPVQSFRIDVRSDTTIHTAGGALIGIPKGALRGAGDNTAQLRIQEAYNIRDMIAAGLVTRSGGEPLSSGGMISIRAGNGAGVEIVQGISVSVPAAYSRPGMQVYKGVRTADGLMDWQNPAQLDSVEKPATYADGKRLYNANCASCHRMDRDATGPALAYITSRRNIGWLENFTRNPSGMIAGGDPYANALFCKWKPTVMTAFPMEAGDMHVLYDYIAEESKSLDPAGIPDDKASFDSCALYRKTIDALKGSQDDLLAQKGNSTQTIAPANDVVVSTMATQVFYRFTVRDTGWYNVDILAKNVPGFVPARLTVQVAGSHSRDLTLYLILPDDRILLNGGPAAGSGDMYAFYKKDGSMPLPQGKQAYLVAMQEAGDKLLFAQDAFVTGTSQERRITLRETTRDALNKAIAGIGINGLSIAADSAQNATGTLTKNEALKAAERLIPKSILCDCRTQNDSSANVYMYDNPRDSFDFR